MYCLPLLLPLLLGLTATVTTATASSSLLYTKESAVIELDAASLEHNVLGQHHLWLVLFHENIQQEDTTTTAATNDESNDDPNSSNNENEATTSPLPSLDASFATEYVRTSTELFKYGVRVGAVDCTKHPKAMKKFGIQSCATATVVAVEGPVTQNPYTHKNLRKVKALRERTSKSLKKWTLRGKGKKLPHFVHTISTMKEFATYQERMKRRGLKGAVLVTDGSKEGRVTPVLRGVSSDLKDRIEIAIVNGMKCEEDLLKMFKISKPPGELFYIILYIYAFKKRIRKKSTKRVLSFSLVFSFFLFFRRVFFKVFSWWCKYK